MTQRSSSKRRNTCCIISLCCLVSGVLGTIVSVFLLYRYFDFFNIWDRMEAEVLKTQNFFSVLALIFIIVFNAGWVFLIPAGVKKESKPFLFTLLGVYLIIIFVVIKSLLFDYYFRSDQVSSFWFHYSFYVADRHPDKGPGLAQKILNYLIQKRF